MTGINIAIKFSIIAVVIVISAITPSLSVISDRRTCFDPKCSVPVSEATTTLTYNSNDPGILSFKSNTPVTVFSKSAGKRPDLWGVEIGGRRGYVPFNLIREKKVLKKTLFHEMPTEEVVTTNDTNPQIKSVPENNDSVSNTPTQETHKADDTKSEPLAQETLRTNGIVETTISQTVPDPSGVSPSFEVHDGTTIPLSMNNEPNEPSYSTVRPEPMNDIGDQPVLSIHPNIASSVTLKTHEVDTIIDDRVNEVEEYMKNTGLRDDSLSKKVSVDNLYVESTQPVLPNVEYPEQISNDTEEYVVQDSPKARDFPSPEKESKTMDIESVALENSDSPVHVTNATDDIEKSFGSHPSELDLQNQATKEQKFTENPIEQVAPIEQFQGPIETTTHFVSEPQLLEKGAEVVEKGINEHRTTEDHKIIQDGGIPVISTPEDTTKAGALPLDTQIGSEASNQQMKVQQVQSDFNNIAVEPENINSIDKVLPIQDEPLPQQSVEAKASEKVPPNLSVMNSLFNRVSNLPSMVEEVVDTMISSDPSEIKSTSDEKVFDVETEMKLTNNEKIVDANLEMEKPNDKRNIDDYNINLNIATDITHKSDVDKSTPAVSVAPNVPVVSEIVVAPNDPVVSEVPVVSELPEVPTLHSTQPEVVESNQDKFVNNDSNNNYIDNEENNTKSTADSTDIQTNREFVIEEPVQPGIYKQDELSGLGKENVAMDETSSFNGFPGNRNLLNVGNGLQPDDYKSVADTSQFFESDKLTESFTNDNENQATTVIPNIDDVSEIVEKVPHTFDTEQDIIPESSDVCLLDSSCQKPEGVDENHSFISEDVHVEKNMEIIDVISIGRNYWETLTYLVVTALTTLLFSLGYYYIENIRRDGQYIAKINKLEKELLVCSKECTVLDDTLKSTKTKLDSIEDESFGSNEMVVSLKADLEASKTAKSELEDQVAMLEKELESATEAGLELERMLREILSTNNEDNPLAQSVEDLQTRLNAQQAANEALTNALNLKTQENDNLTSDLTLMTQKCEQLEVEVTRLTEELKQQNNIKSNLEHTLLEKIEHFEKQVKDISAERINLRQQLKGKEMELKDLIEVVNQMNINNLDFDKLYNVSRVKAEASQLLEERDDLKIRLSEVEGAHQLLEEHVKLINEEVSSLSEQCKLAEKAKRDAETRVEVLSNFFKEKEAQRQKEEAVWLQKQGEVSSTVERLQTMQNEIHNYKQQIEMLKREIVDQEREYKNQIATLETKSHENWVISRQNERRLEESKAEAGQLRNRLTLIEKNLNEADPDVKLHRLEANGDTATSPQLFIGAEASSSPIMFTGSSGVPLPPPPSYLYGPPVPPFMPPPPHGSSGIPPYEVGQRPPPLGGRLSSPPPLHGPNSGRYDNSRSPPPLLSPPLLPPYGHPPHRAFPPFPNERIHPPPPPPHSTISPPWGEDTLAPLRNSGFQPHQQQQQQQQQQLHHHHRDQQRARNHKGSLHSSGESLDKNL